MSRRVAQLRFQVGQRVVTIRATDSVGPEDCYENLISGVLHRYVTGEDLVMPVAREVKDFIIKTNLTV